MAIHQREILAPIERPFASGCPGGRWGWCLPTVLLAALIGACTVTRYNHEPIPFDERFVRIVPNERLADEGRADSWSHLAVPIAAPERDGQFLPGGREGDIDAGSLGRAGAPPSSCHDRGTAGFISAAIGSRNIDLSRTLAISQGWRPNLHLDTIASRCALYCPPSVVASGVDA